MRFQCRIGASVVSPAQPVTRRATLGSAALHTAEHSWARRSAIAAAVVVAVSGCAIGTMPRAAATAKSYKIAPVYEVTNAGSNAESYFALGQYHEEARAWDKASAAYRQAVAFDGRHVESWNALGVTLAYAGRYAEAEAALRQAVVLAPGRLHLRNNLGYVLMLAGKPAEAVVALQPVGNGQGASSTARANLIEATARAAAAADNVQPATQPTAALAASQSGSPSPETAASATVQAPVTAVATSTAAPSTMRVGYVPDAPALRPLEAGPKAAPPAAVAADATPPSTASALRTATTSVRLEVTNGNGVTGMAGQVGRWLVRHGMPVAHASNLQPFVQRITIVQYRSGYEEAAMRVVRALPVSAGAEPAATAGLRGDVRVLLGRDWVQAAACLGRNTCQPSAPARAAFDDLTIAAARR